MIKQMKFIGVKDKASEVYSVFSFEDFWHYINPKEDLVFELRMKRRDKTSAKEDIQELANLIRVPYHFTGVFVRTANEYKKACAYCYKNKLTLYLSINPKRKSIHGNDGKKYLTFNGKMQSDLKITHMLIDFDATDALKEDREVQSEEVCYSIAKKFLKEQANLQNYCMICSGNGIQLRIKLDKEILLPAPTYDAHQQFIITEEWSTYSRVLKEAMRSVIEKYNTPRVLVDLTSLELARVGRSPFSGNFKNPDKPKYAGVIEICNNEENVGLYNYVMSFFDKVLKVETAMQEISADVAEEFKYGIENIYESKLAKMFLEPLPIGGRNNTLFFQFKILCNQNGIPLNHPDIISFVRRIERIQNHAFPLNKVPDGAQFNPEAIINYCIEKRIKPPYEVLYRIKERRRKINPEDLEYHEGLLLEALPEERNPIRRIIMDLKKYPIPFDSKYYRKAGIQMLMQRIARTYGREFVHYLLETKVLKDVLEKI